MRHGAAIGLREILKFHSESAGKNCFTKESEQHQQNQRWLEDLSIRLLKILILDRFSDYVSDKVVTPVKETCGQILGIILKQMEVENVKKVLENLLIMASHEKWEISSSGLLVFLC
jgi:TATA-binding protein-associated factor